MSEQTTTSSDATQQEGNQGQSANQPETLEQVYQNFGIEDQAEQFQQARQQNVTVQQPVIQQQPQQDPAALIPDPTLDPQGYRQYELQRLKDQHALRQTLNQVAVQLSQQQQQAARREEEADIRKAVTVLKEKIPGVDDDMLEIALGHKARRDPKFMALWQQRGQKPEAWGRALAAVAVEFSGKFGARQDPQLTENTRAMRAAVGAAASTTRQSSSDERFDTSDPRKFAAEWDRYVSSGGY